MLIPDKLNRETTTHDPQGTFNLFIAMAKAAGIVVLTDEEREIHRQDFLSALSPSEDLWIFAYGSLMWNPAIEFIEERLGVVTGWHRDFCIYSPVGRGSLETPALMLGLNIGGQCQGKVYRIAAAHKEYESALLWKRECCTDMYIPTWIEVDTAQGKVNAMVFAVDRQNQRYRDHHTLEEKAKIIAMAYGEWGTNKAYLLNLANTLKHLGIPDPLIETLAKKVKNHPITSEKLP